MINMLSRESLIGGTNVNSSMDLWSTGSLLEMSTPNVESLMSPNFRSSNDITTSIWIGELCVEMMTSSINSRKAVSRGFVFKILKTCCFLLVQGKLTNLTVEECFAFNVSLRMFTRSIPYTYRSDLKRKEAYTAYSNPRGFIYQNKDKQNRLIRIDELHKFSDDTLNDVRTALDDRLKGIRMKYLPQTIWRRSDKEIAAAMIQDIDKQLKTKRIMRSLEKFVDSQVTPTKHGRMTKPYSSPRFIANCFNAGHLKMEVKARLGGCYRSLGEQVRKARSRSNKGFFGVYVAKLTTDRLVNGSSCGRIGTVIKDLDLEPKVDAMMRDFFNPSRWKELSKEASSKILPCREGSCWKTFKPIASLIAKGKLK
nr:hypothetical protein [Tanacetum cinerariifolium]